MSDSGSDYDHWPDSFTVASGATAVPGYDTHNGLRECEYLPANEGQVLAKKDDNKKNEPEKDEQASAPALMSPYQLAAPIGWMPNYGGYPYMCYPGPVYYGVPPTGPYGYGYGMPVVFGYPSASPAMVPPSAVKDEAKPKEDTKPKDDAKKKDGGKPKDESKTKDDAKAEKKKERKPKPSEPMKWQGRTKAEVEEDDVKIAAREEALAKRKVAPVGLQPDQQVWVVTEDAKQRVMTFAEANEMKGEWREDPRFKGSLYFVCEQEKPKEEDGKTDKKKKEGKKGGKKD